MHAAILSVHLLLAFALIVVVLLQRSEGGGLGMGGGGVMTSRGAATALSKVTWVVGLAFVATSLTLTIIAAREAGGGSLVDAVLPPAAGTADAPAVPVPGDGGLLPQMPAAGAPATPDATAPATPAPVTAAPEASTPAPQAPAADGPAAPPPVQ